MTVGPSRVRAIGASLQRFMSGLFEAMDAAGASDGEILDGRLKRIEADLAALRRDLDDATGIQDHSR